MIGQLAYLQIGYGSRFKAEVQKSNSAIVSSQVPRGVMYDNKGRVLVGNKAKNAITYTKSVSTTTEDIYAISNSLSHYISIKDEQPTEQQVIDYYLANKENSAKESAKVPKSVRATQDDNLINQKSKNRLVQNTLS